MLTVPGESFPKKYKPEDEESTQKSVINSFLAKTIDHSMYVSGFSCTPATSIPVISVVLSGYRCVPLLVQICSGLLLLPFR